MILISFFISAHSRWYKTVLALSIPSSPGLAPNSCQFSKGSSSSSSSEDSSSFPSSPSPSWGSSCLLNACPSGDSAALGEIGGSVEMLCSAAPSAPGIVSCTTEIGSSSGSPAAFPSGRVGRGDSNGCGSIAGSPATVEAVENLVASASLPRSWRSSPLASSEPFVATGARGPSASSSGCVAAVGLLASDVSLASEPSTGSGVWGFRHCKAGNEVRVASSRESSPPACAGVSGPRLGLPCGAATNCSPEPDLPLAVLLGSRHSSSETLLLMP
mmetsp:Transcript_59664/g.112488  ORF Transcript_59664/g.112488 Transcript_59664/m.112488 type:complete len:272 (-) Transcript_59664:2183-2998(-)